MPKSKIWTKEEIEYLSANWGLKSVPFIARHLNRTETAIILKAKRMRLGAASTSGEYLTANQVSKLLGVDIHTVMDRWILKHGLKAKKRVIRTRRMMTMIKFTELVNWLKNNQDKWDSRRLELFALGKEFDWLKEKRRNDLSLPVKKFHKWTKEDDMIAIHLFRAGFTYRQIAERLGRSEDAVERRLSRLDVWGTGKYIGDRVKAI